MLAKYNCVLSSLSVPTRALMAGNEASKQTRAFETLFGSCHLGWGWHSRSEHQGKLCFCFSLERNGKSCGYRHERELGLDNWSLWQAFPWLCCPERGKSLTGTSQGFTDETSLKPNHERWQLMGGEKKNLQNGTGCPPSRSLHRMSKVICGELGREVYLKTSLEHVYNILRCLILLWTVDSFLPLKSMWELPAKQKRKWGQSAWTPKRASKSWRDYKIRDDQE